MVDDKNKTRTKQALLGELESIKSLLEESQDDIIDFDDESAPAESDFDPPILTTAVDEAGDNGDQDIPVLTEAFDNVIVEIEAEPTFQQWPDTGAEDELDLSLDAGPEEDSDDDASNSLFDDLELEFEQQFSKTEAEEADTQPEITAESKPEVEQIKAEKTEAEKAKTERTKRAQESQPSLFDAEPEDLLTEQLQPEQLPPENVPAEQKAPPLKTPKHAGVSETTKPANATATTNAALKTYNRPLAKPGTGDIKTAGQQQKANNPFLPKHIRDRLHTNRSLQDEIMHSSASTASTIPAAKISATKPFVTNSASSEENQLIDELVQNYLPKIERELRRRLREIIDKKNTANRDNS